MDRSFYRIEEECKKIYSVVGAQQSTLDNQTALLHHIRIRLNQQQEVPISHRISRQAMNHKAEINFFVNQLLQLQSQLLREVQNHNQQMRELQEQQSKQLEYQTKLLENMCTSNSQLAAAEVVPPSPFVADSKKRKRTENDLDL
ncbi:expressed unknown protein [Seminavis robusta]|uniref:Uncharacterized protein n=1 Tax=Seminavis robusta TaxID=568900 RepID=A0A9N8F425_9STRA|nr:expressed unknown protein [Seminavis robusta]|eukprot:Sro3833_g351330.1 n/a (144) ;mRNA; f:3112-3543